MREGTLEAAAAGTAQMDDSALVQGVKAGESAALAALWQRFGPRLHGYAASCLRGDKDLADDIVVQAMAGAVRSIPRFNPGRGTLSSWIFGITRRVIQEEIRRQHRRGDGRTAEVPLNDLSESDAIHTPSDPSSPLEAQRKVRLLAASLTSAEMEVLVLHLVHEFTVREIAGLMGKSWRAIDSLLYRARVKARERLAQDGE